MKNEVRLLIVDDEPLVRHLIRTALEASGNFKIFEAEDGLEALLYLRKIEFEWVISDQPTGSVLGTQILGYIERNHPQTCQFVLFSNDIFLVQDLNATKRCPAYLKTDLKKMVLLLEQSCSIHLKS